MGCLSIIVRRMGGCSLAVKVQSVITLAVQAVKGASLSVRCAAVHPSVRAERVPGMTVSAGMVCTASLDSGVELWWTDTYKMLWDNGKVTLWTD